MKKSQLFLVLASLGSMFISIVPALVQTNRRLGMKREIEQRLDTFGKRWISLLVNARKVKLRFAGISYFKPTGQVYMGSAVNYFASWLEHSSYLVDLNSVLLHGGRGLLEQHPKQIEGWVGYNHVIRDDLQSSLQPTQRGILQLISQKRFYVRAIETFCRATPRNFRKTILSDKAT